jgi:hypothetical protein
MGIEPSLDSVLSYSVGLLLGVAVSHLRGRDVTEEEFEMEFKGVLGLLNSRAWELREAISKAPSR